MDAGLGHLLDRFPLKQRHITDEACMVRTYLRHAIHVSGRYTAAAIPHEWYRQQLPGAQLHGSLRAIYGVGHDNRRHLQLGADFHQAQYLSIRQKRLGHGHRI